MLDFCFDVLLLVSHQFVSVAQILVDTILIGLEAYRLVKDFNSFCYVLSVYFEIQISLGFAPRVFMSWVSYLVFAVSHTLVVQRNSVEYIGVISFENFLSFEVVVAEFWFPKCVQNLSFQNVVINLKLRSFYRVLVLVDVVLSLLVFSLFEQLF